MRTLRFYIIQTLVVFLSATSITVLTLNAQITGPEQDCIKALPICDTTFIQPNVYKGYGKINELGPFSCIGSERNAVWYQVTVQTDGEFGFVLQPNNAHDDYDWSVFLMHPGKTCSDLVSGALPEISCNNSTTPGETGPNGAGTESRQDGQGSPFNAKIPVRAGEVYLIVITHYNATEGYTLNFTSSSSGVIGSAETQAPILKAIQADQNTCSLAGITLQFSNYIFSASVQPSSLVVMGADSVIYPILNVIPSRGLQSKDNFDTAFTLVLSRPIEQSGVYKIQSIGAIRGFCQSLSFSDSITLILPVLKPKIKTNSTVFCPGGSVVLDVGGGYISYSWKKSGSAEIFGTTQTLRVYEPGTYTVTVRDKSGCSGSIAQSVIYRTEDIVPEIRGYRFICQDGTGVLDAGNGTYSRYEWSTGDSTSSIRITKAGAYSVTVTDWYGCSGTATAIITSTNTITPTITGKVEFCEGGSTTLDAGDYQEYQWYNNDTLIKDAKSRWLTCTESGLYKVRVFANGCTDESNTLTVIRHVLPVKPIITGKGNILTASAAQWYRWYYHTSRGKNLLSGVTLKEFIPVSSGTYSVTVGESTGCENSSEPFSFTRVTGSAQLTVGQDTIIAKTAGEFVSIPMYVRDVNNLEQSGVRELQVTLQCNASVLSPSANANILADTVDAVSGVRSLRLRLPVVASGENGLLSKFTFQALNGKSPTSVLKLSNAIALPANIGVTLTTTSGYFRLERWIPAFATEPPPASLTLTIFPNPAQENLECVVTLPETDNPVITITDTFGNPIKTLSSGVILSAGRNTISATLGDLPKGTYFVLVKGSSYRASTGFTIIR